MDCLGYPRTRLGNTGLMHQSFTVTADDWSWELHAHPELLLHLAGVGLGVQAIHVVVDGAELRGRNGGVSTEAGLQDGIVDEDILLLGGGGGATIFLT